MTKQTVGVIIAAITIVAILNAQYEDESKTGLARGIILVVASVYMVRKLKL